MEYVITPRFNPIHNLVAHGPVDTLQPFLDRLGGGSVSHQAGRKGTGSLAGEDSGRDDARDAGGLTVDVFDEERHDYCVCS